MAKIQKWPFTWNLAIRYFLAIRLPGPVMQSAEDFSPARMEQLLDDFREGFDRRLSLLVTNHMLCE